MTLGTASQVDETQAGGSGRWHIQHDSKRVTQSSSWIFGGTGGWRRSSKRLRR